MQILSAYSLKNLNTFGVEAAAKYFAEVPSCDELLEVVANPALAGMAKLVLGGGSNVLFTRDFDGLVICNSIHGIEAVRGAGCEVTVTAGGGVAWQELVAWCVRENLAGLENLTLIPGSVGAAPVQNIGAYGAELKDVFEGLRAVDLHTGEVRTMNAADCRFGYRESVFKHEYRSLFMIVSVSFRLTDLSHPDARYRFRTDQGELANALRGHPAGTLTLAQVSRAVADIRRAKLPDPEVFGNAGSFFKNPLVSPARFQMIAAEFPDVPHYPEPGGRIKIPAAWLIERCGWKGKVVGHAGTSKNHALILVNYGGATGREILALAYSIQQSVIDKFAIELIPEVNIL